MRKLLAANLTRLKKTPLFWGILLLEVVFALVRVSSSYADSKIGYEIRMDELLFTYISVAGLLLAVFTAVFLGTEYHDGAIRNKLVAGHKRSVIYLANFVTVLLACLLFTAAYILTALAAGVSVFGFPTLGFQTVLALFLGTLALSAAYCALYTLLTMSSSHKATSAILCILLFLCLLFVSTYVAAILDASPEHLAYSLVDGQMVSHMEPNPHYLQPGLKRDIFVFLNDFLPTGQAMQYVLLSAKPLLLSLYSIGIAFVSTAGGLLYFHRKDIK